MRCEKCGSDKINSLHALPSDEPCKPSMLVCIECYKIHRPFELKPKPKAQKVKI